MDEDEVVEVVSFGSGETAVIAMGLDMAMLRVRSDYIRGRIEVEEFENEVDRLLRKRARFYGAGS